MKKRIKKFGNSLVLVITKEEGEILHLKEGDVVDVEIKKERTK